MKIIITIINLPTRSPDNAAGFELILFRDCQVLPPPTLFLPERHLESWTRAPTERCEPQS